MSLKKMIKKMGWEDTELEKAKKEIMKHSFLDEEEQEELLKTIDEICEELTKK